jgi:hypothetical protein
MRNQDQFFHGTSAPLTEVTPGKHSLTSYGTSYAAYATTDEDQAWRYAETSRDKNPNYADIGGENYDRVFKVAPKNADDVVPDRHHQDWGKPDGRHQSSTGFDVTGELDMPKGTQGRLFAVNMQKYSHPVHVDQSIHYQSHDVDAGRRRNAFMSSWSASKEDGRSGYEQAELPGLEDERRSSWVRDLSEKSQAADAAQKAGLI